MPIEFSGSRRATVLARGINTDVSLRGGYSFAYAFSSGVFLTVPVSLSGRCASAGGGRVGFAGAQEMGGVWGTTVLSFAQALLRPDGSHAAGGEPCPNPPFLNSISSIVLTKRCIFSARP